MDFEDAARLLEGSNDYRILRRVPDVAHWALNPPSGETRRAVLVDTETTGLEDSDEVIELALLPVDYERDTGRIVAVDIANALSAFRQPSAPIPAASTESHGVTNEMVTGQTIDAERVRGVIERAQLVIAHNAAFDRPMVEKHWPLFEEKHWACSFVDIDWKAEGIGSAKLDYLLFNRGYFHDGHRALSDALATLFLLSSPLPKSQKLGLAALLESARRQLHAVRAEETAFEQRAALKARGYRWDEGQGARRKAWWILANDTDAEIAWLMTEIYRDEREVSVVNVPATRRYSSRLWPPTS